MSDARTLAHIKSTNRSRDCTEPEIDESLILWERKRWYWCFGWQGPLLTPGWKDGAGQSVRSSHPGTAAYRKAMRGDPNAVTDWDWRILTSEVTDAEGWQYARCCWWRLRQHRLGGRSHENITDCVKRRQWVHTHNVEKLLATAKKGAVHLYNPLELAEQKRQAKERTEAGVKEIWALIADLDGNMEFKSMAKALLDPVAMRSVAVTHYKIMKELQQRALDQLPRATIAATEQWGGSDNPVLPPAGQKLQDNIKRIMGLQGVVGRILRPINRMSRPRQGPDSPTRPRSLQSAIVTDSQTEAAPALPPSPGARTPRPSKPGNSRLQPLAQPDSPRQHPPGPEAGAGSATQVHDGQGQGAGQGQVSVQLADLSPQNHADMLAQKSPQDDHDDQQQAVNPLEPAPMLPQTPLPQPVAEAAEAVVPAAANAGSHPSGIGSHPGSQIFPGHASITKQPPTAGIDPSPPAAPSSPRTPAKAKVSFASGVFARSMSLPSSRRATATAAAAAAVATTSLASPAASGGSRLLSRIGSLGHAVRHAMGRHDRPHAPGAFPVHVAHSLLGPACNLLGGVPTAVGRMQLSVPELECAAGHALCIYGDPEVYVGSQPLQGYYETIEKYTGVPEQDVLMAVWRSQAFCPAHYVAVDHGKKKIVVCIRGTMEAVDTIADLLGKPQPMDFGPGLFGVVHQGVMEAAGGVYQSVMEDVLEAAAEHPDYTIFVTGHSLGGGAAALVALLIRKDHRLSVRHREHLRAVCLAPAAVMNKALGLACQPFIASVIWRHDMVPRIDTGSVAKFVQQVAMASPLKRAMLALWKALRLEKDKKTKATGATADAQKPSAQATASGPTPAPASSSVAAPSTGKEDSKEAIEDARENAPEKAANSGAVAADSGAVAADSGAVAGQDEDAEQQSDTAAAQGVGTSGHQDQAVQSVIKVEGSDPVAAAGPSTPSAGVDGEEAVVAASNHSNGVVVEEVVVVDEQPAASTHAAPVTSRPTYDIAADTRVSGADSGSDDRCGQGAGGSLGVSTGSEELLSDQQNALQNAVAQLQQVLAAWTGSGKPGTEQPAASGSAGAPEHAPTAERRSPHVPPSMKKLLSFVRKLPHNVAQRMSGSGGSDDAEATTPSSHTSGPRPHAQPSPRERRPLRRLGHALSQRLRPGAHPPAMSPSRPLPQKGEVDVAEWEVTEAALVAGENQHSFLQHTDSNQERAATALARIQSALRALANAQQEASDVTQGAGTGEAASAEGGGSSAPTAEDKVEKEMSAAWALVQDLFSNNRPQRLAATQPLQTVLEDSTPPMSQPATPRPATGTPLELPAGAATPEPELEGAAGAAAAAGGSGAPVSPSGQGEPVSEPKEEAPLDNQVVVEAEVDVDVCLPLPVSSPPPANETPGSADAAATAVASDDGTPAPATASTQSQTAEPCAATPSPPSPKAATQAAAAATKPSAPTTATTAAAKPTVNTNIKTLLQPILPPGSVFWLLPDNQADLRRKTNQRLESPRNMETFRRQLRAEFGFTKRQRAGGSADTSATATEAPAVTRTAGVPAANRPPALATPASSTSTASLGPTPTQQTPGGAKVPVNIMGGLMADLTDTSGPEAADATSSVDVLDDEVVGSQLVLLEASPEWFTDMLFFVRAVQDHMPTPYHKALKQFLRDAKASQQRQLTRRRL